MQDIKQLQVFLVGGAIRDELLGLQSVERDWVVVGSTEQQMLSLGFNKVGKDFPVFINPKTGEEYALARVERKTAKGYYGFSCDASPKITLEEDLMRRDLTINAIAKDSNGKIIDPFNGQRDLQRRVLRHVSDAFIEDPIRVLRVARFMAKLGQFGFTVAPETIEVMQQIVNNQELEHVSPERVWKELEKVLLTDYPEKFFATMRDSNALVKIFPELDKLWGIPQSPEWHPEIDTGLHTMLSLQQAVKLSRDPIVRFAVLCHDLGKGTTKPELLPKHHGHEHRGVSLVNNWCSKYKVPNSYKNLAVRAAKWHLHSHRALELNPKTILELFEGLDAFRQPQNLSDFLIACTADARGRHGNEHDSYAQADFLQQIFAIIKQISADEFIKQGLIGKNIGEAIRKQQLYLIKKFKQQYTNQA